MLALGLTLLSIAPWASGPDPLREGAVDVRTTAIAVLRDSRRREGPSHEVVVERLVRCGTEVLDPLLDLLCERKLPALCEPERAQTLSEPQREMIVAALSRWSARAVLANMDARVELDPSEPIRVAALYVYGSHGSARELDHVLELATLQPALPDGATDLSADLAEALRTAVARILGRDERGFRDLSRVIGRAGADQARPILFALGDTGNACSIPALASAMSIHPELAAIAISQARRVGASMDHEANGALSSAVRPHLGAARVELASAAARTLGELCDAASAQRLVELLDAAEPALAESAHWSLRRMSGLDFGPCREAWVAWLASEREWWNGEASERIDELVRGSRATRLAAVASVGARTWRRHEAALALVAALRDNDPVLREAACHALGQLGAPLSLPHLVETLSDSDPRVSRAAREALESIAGTNLPDTAEECARALHIAP
ncbi:MAG: HEAT repeat domain-containing protein [Planctomycetes bacterium]|nr:HEAT repeat domain-containing protein [Planctomycetota bacterium]